MTVTAQNVLALIAIAGASLTALRVFARLRDVTEQLDECTRDRAILRSQVNLVVRTVLNLIPDAQRPALARRIQELELVDDEAA